MKINDSSDPLRPVSVGGSSAGKRAVANNGPTEVSGASSDSVKVQLSGQAAQLSQLESQFAQSDFDVKKVAEISQAIRDGNFKVSSTVVADKLLASANELLQQA